MRLKFHVDGEPKEWPKEVVRIIPNPAYNPKVKSKQPIGFPQTFKRKSKKDPLAFKRWTTAVELAAVCAIGRATPINHRSSAQHTEVFPFYKKGPLGIRVRIYRTRAKSNKNQWPVTRPDGDNFFYLIHNVLEGMVYKDDSQLCVFDEIKLWAGGEHTPGADIEVWELEEPPVGRS